MHENLIRMGFKIQGDLDAIRKHLHTEPLRETLIKPISIDYADPVSGAIITLRNEPISTKWGLNASALSKAQFLESVIVNHEEAHQEEALKKSEVFTGGLEPTSLEPAMYYGRDLVISVYGIHLAQEADEKVRWCGVGSFSSTHAKYNLDKWLTENPAPLLVDWTDRYKELRNNGHLYDRLINLGAEPVRPLTSNFQRGKAEGGMYELTAWLRYNDHTYHFNTIAHIREAEVDEQVARRALVESCFITGAGIAVSNEDGVFPSKDFLLEYEGKFYMAPSRFESLPSEVYDLVQAIRMFGSTVGSEQQLLDAGFKVVV